MKLLCPEGTKSDNNFDFTRILLALMVLFCHSYVIYYGSLDPEPFWQLTKHQLSIGTGAINFFFIISGFLISRSWNQSKGYWPFLMKRLLRIYPAFIAVCLFCVFVIAPLGLDNAAAIPAYFTKIPLRSLVLTTFILHEPILHSTFQAVPLHTVNSSLWSISYEFICYQAIPLFALAGVFRKPAWALVVFLTVLILNVLHLKAYTLYSATGIVRYDHVCYYPERYFERFIQLEHLMLPFTAGVIFYAYQNYIPRSPYVAICSLFCLVITIRWVPCFEIAQSTFGAYLLFYFIFNKCIVFHNFAKYGDFSYGIYLYSWPVQQILMLYIGSNLNIFGLFFTSLASVMPLAAMSWRIIEKPAAKLKLKIPASERVSKLIGKVKYSWAN